MIIRWILAFIFILFSYQAFAHKLEFSQGKLYLNSDYSYRLEIQVEILDLLKTDFELKEVSPAQADIFLQAPKEKLDAIMATVAEQIAGELEFTDQKDNTYLPDTTQLPDSTIIKAIARGYMFGSEESAGIFIFSGQFPKEVTDIKIQFPEMFGEVSLAIIRTEQQMIAQGDASQTISLKGQNNSFATTVVEYLILGYYHILPAGLDHILFVLGLFLLTIRLKPLLWQITAFTLAHSITLALAIYGIVNLSADIIEPIIALSITFIAIENIFVKKLMPWRPIIVFGFGLIHGMGFASVLTELGLTQDYLVTALVSFNIGVELGQISVILIALLLVGWFRNRPWYHLWITVPFSLAIAITGGYWTIERIMG